MPTWSSSAVRTASARTARSSAPASPSSRGRRRNVRTCLEAAGGTLADVVKWTILAVAGTDVQGGLAAFGEVWPQDAPPPAITVAFVSGLGPPGALVEIEAVAAVRPAACPRLAQPVAARAPMSGHAPRVRGRYRSTGCVGRRGVREPVRGPGRAGRGR
ncbi:MAG TPA: RidA family protein [Pseudonocardia sp.]|nr:RidA family protein [Pseudonocardia sp.]